MKAYEWMVQPTPQKEWADGRGVFLWLAFFFGGLGGGLFVVSGYFNSLVGMAVGWLIVLLLKGSCHLAFLGHPARFWRAFSMPRSSWISRGLLFFSLFALLGAASLWASKSLPGTGVEYALKLSASALAFLTAIYPGFILNYVNGVAFWNSALLPVLFVTYGATGGLALAVALSLAGEQKIDLGAAETTLRLFLIAVAVLLGTYLLSARYTGEAGRKSVAEVVRGRLSLVFWLGVVIAGLVIPLFVSIYSLVTDQAAPPLLGLAVSCELAGGASLRYVVLKGALYRPLV